MSDQPQKFDLDPATLATIQAVTAAVMAPFLERFDRQAAAARAPAQAALPAPRKQESPERAEIRRLINEHCDRTRERFDDAARRCHLAYDGGRALADSKGLAGRASGVDVLEVRGELPAFLEAVRRELPNRTAQLALPPVRPTSRRRPERPVNATMAAAMAVRGLNEQGLANHAGLSLSTIARVLRGDVPGKHTKRKIAQMLRKEVLELWPVVQVAS